MSIVGQIPNHTPETLSLDTPKLLAVGSPPTIGERIYVIDTVRKWGLTYDGGKDPLGFIERIEELAEMDNVNVDHLPRIMPVIFSEKALIWFRNNNKQWTRWESFKKDFNNFFLPPRYFVKLDDEILKRTQRPRETFKDYVLALQNLMRPTRLTEEQKVERIFRNAAPDYQCYIRRKDFTNLDDLAQLADDLESIPTTTLHSRQDHHRMLQQNAPQSGNIRRQSTSSGHGCVDTGRTTSNQKVHSSNSDNIVEYSDVSSTNSSDPEAGELDSDTSLGKPCNTTVEKKGHIVTNKIINKPATLKPVVRSDINLNSEEENYRNRRKDSFDSLSKLFPDHVRRIVFGSPVHSSAKINLSEGHTVSKVLDGQNKKDKKHKRSRKSKKSKKKRNKPYSNMEGISDNDSDVVLNNTLSLRHYTPPTVGAIAAKSLSDPTYTPIHQRSPISSDTPPPIRPDSSTSYYPESANKTVQPGVSTSTSSSSTNNIVGLLVSVSNRNKRHRTPPRTSTTKSRFPNPHTPHTPPWDAGSSTSVLGHDIRNSRCVISPNKDDHHYHHLGRQEISGAAGNRHYHQSQTAAIISENQKYKDTDRYYRHQPSTLPHQKRKLHDMSNAGNTPNYYDHDSRSSSRNIRVSEEDRYNRDNYYKRYSRSPNISLMRIRGGQSPPSSNYRHTGGSNKYKNPHQPWRSTSGVLAPQKPLGTKGGNVMPKVNSSRFWLTQRKLLKYFYFYPFILVYELLFSI